MDQQNPSDANSPAISPAPAPRCQYRTATGRQCRSTAVDDSAFCSRHDPVVMEEADLSARLSLGEGSSRSANGINQSLANLFTLLAEDRIAPRRAAVLAYISSLLLRSIRDAEEQIKRNPPPKLPVRIFWGPLGGNRVQIIPDPSGSSEPGPANPAP